MNFTKKNFDSFFIMFSQLTSYVACLLVKLEVENHEQRNILINYESIVLIKLIGIPS